jgi:probable rRNA maturation factor
MSARGASQVEVEVEAPAWTRTLPNAERLTRQAASAALRDLRGAVVILLADDARVHELNRRFRDKDAPTNVLAFPAPANAAGHLGDIALAFGVCAAEAAEQGKPLADHLRHLVVHGVLHLIGYDHQDDAQALTMEALERDLLAQIGLPDPYTPRPALTAETERRPGG